MNRVALYDAAPSLELLGVYRSYGDRMAVSNLDLQIDRGRIVALLGQNGAGKTTTVKIAATLLLPDKGAVSVGGHDAIRKPRRARALTGLVLGGDRGFYDRASVFSNLMFYADVAGIPGRERVARCENALAQVELIERRGDSVGELSRGLVQRLHLARALVANPILLLLDEPSSGLDVEAARRLRQLIKSIADSGTGVLLTTHSMPEAEALADRIDVIRDGSIVARGDTTQMAKAAGIGAATTVITEHLDPNIIETLGAHDGVAYVDSVPIHGRAVCSILWKEAPDFGVLSELLGPSAEVTTRPPTLEEAYLALAGSG